MKLEASAQVFEKYCESAATYWANNLSDANIDRYVLVEVMHEEMRVAIRNLTIANAIRRICPARLIVLTGTDSYWFNALYSEFDLAVVRQLSAAFGATEVIDLHDVVDRYIDGASTRGQLLGMLGGRAGDSSRRQIDPSDLKANAESTVCRLLKLPKPANVRGAEEIMRRTEGFAAAYEELFARLRPVALVTSHVDYNQWGLGVEAAKRYEVPVVHTQSTGGLKAYSWFPEYAVDRELLRSQVTRRIGEWFDGYIWPRRDTLRRSAELIAWRAKGNLGRPSWWRGGADASADLLTDRERHQVREVAAHRLLFDPSLPTIGVFNHAVSDARGTNIEIFCDLAAWLEETAQYAAHDNRANWLFLDHPAQFRYDGSRFFEQVAERHADKTHMAFRPNSAVSKNFLWSLVNVGVTVRGSVSNELPAYGIPVIQAGWSEWSACGFSDVADDQSTYWKLLDTHIEGAWSHRAGLSAEQIERARLWHWLYRCGTDISSPIVPHWEQGSGDDLLRSVSTNMRHVEADGDPVFLAVWRMWSRREPFLTRFDLTSGTELETAVLSESTSDE